MRSLASSLAGSEGEGSMHHCGIVHVNSSKVNTWIVHDPCTAVVYVYINVHGCM